MVATWAGLLLAIGLASGPDAQADDAFLCHRSARGLRSVGSDGQTFGLPPPAVPQGRLSQICRPVGRAGGPAIDPDTHLSGHRVVGGGAVRETWVAHDDLGSLTLETGRLTGLFLPASVSEQPTAAPDPASHALDAFACRHVRVARGTPRIPRGTRWTVGAIEYEIGQPGRLCSPIAEVAASIRDSGRHLLCYRARVRQRETLASGLHVANALGIYQTGWGRATELCLPTRVSQDLRFAAPAEEDVLLDPDLAALLLLPPGSEPRSLRVELDGAEVSAAFRATPPIAEGVLAGLPTGVHELVASIDVGGEIQTTRVRFVRVHDPAVCDALNGVHCLLPYPSSFFLVPAPTASGVRLNLPQVGLPQPVGPPVDPGPYNELDGFSPGVQILMHFPDGVDPVASGAAILQAPGCCGQPAGPPWIDTRTYTGRSLEPDSPTVLLDADTGERVIHFVENDANAGDDRQRRLFFLRPGVALKPGHRYLVAVRRLLDESGAPVRPEPVFRRLRDGVPTGIPEIDARGPVLRDTVLAPLAAHGIDPSELQLAFDFVVQSDPQLTRQILAMRDQALAWLAAQDPAVPTFQVNEVIESDCSDPATASWREIHGTFRSPLFLTQAPTLVNVPVHSVDGSDTPVQNGTMDANFSFSLPCGALDPAGPRPRALLLAHGGFQTARRAIEIYPPFFHPVEPWNYVAGGSEWIGFTGPELVWIATRIVGLTSHQFNNLPAFFDRMRQGVLNQLVFARMMKLGLFNLDPAFRTPGGEGVLPGPSEDLFYWGPSLGGGNGLFLAALTSDIERFALDVPVFNISLMMQRSTQLAQFTTVTDLLGLSDPIDAALTIALFTELWASAEALGYAHHVMSDPLPGSFPKRILIAAAWLDQQVTNLADEMAARTLGLASLEGSLLQGLQGIPDRPGPLDSAYVVHDTGSFDLFEPLHQPYFPLTNEIPRIGCDPHGYRFRSPAAIQQISAFLRPGGQAENFCNGLCDAEGPLEWANNLTQPCNPLE